MKRVLFLLALAVCVVALTSFNTTAAGADKVKLCHHNPDMDDDPPLEWFVIEVAPSAVDAHVNNHGDCVLPSDAVVGEPCACVVGQ
jgi:hypothetical protein